LDKVPDDEKGDISRQQIIEDGDNHRPRASFKTLDGTYFFDFKFLIISLQAKIRILAASAV
jgi:hypothetical protein